MIVAANVMYMVIAFGLLGVFAATVTNPTLPDAQFRFLKGNYSESRDLYSQIARDPVNRSAIAVGLAKCWMAEGEFDKAQSVLNEAISVEPKADLLSCRARLAYLRGNWEAADLNVAAALKLDSENFAARWIAAQLLLDRGEYEKADAEFRWFVRTYVARNRAGKDIKDPDELLIVAQAGAENARWHKLIDQFRFILNEVLGDAIRGNANYWPAEAFAGSLLLEKFNKAEALAAFDKALAINPRAAEALVGKGRLAAQHFEYAEADSYADRALSVNPRDVPALLLAADVSMICGDDGAASSFLEKALAVNPKSEAALGRKSALAMVRATLNIDRQALERAVLQLNPKPGRFYFEQAVWLDARRRYDLARDNYRKAVELFPQLTPARVELGLLTLRMGDEDTAKKLLTEAFDADPFHIRVANSLKVLRHLEKYKTESSAHFVLRFDERHDPVLGRLLIEELENDYEALAREFNHRPNGPFIFEVFNNQEIFSGRIICSPDLHTVGASTGRVVAIASPRASGVAKPFNWARVVRHELTHVFNLDQTNYLVPHWLTEGLAVCNEGFGRPAEWSRALANRLAQDKLYSLSTINAGFTRPKSSEDWALAYCQAEIYVEYLKKTFGSEVIGKLLAGYRDGLQTSDIVQRCCGINLAQLEAGYLSEVKKIVDQGGIVAADKPMSFAQLEAARAKEPDNANILARLAEQFLKRKRGEDARQCIETALAKDATNGLAIALKAQLLISAGDEDKAYDLLQAACDSARPHPRCLRMLGTIQLNAGRYEEAIATFERGHKLQPAEPEWWADLSRAAKAAGDLDKCIAAMQNWLYHDADEFEQRRELARLAMELEKFPVAERSAREAIDIDPSDDESQKLLIAALQKQGKRAEAERWKKLLRVTDE